MVMSVAARIEAVDQPESREMIAIENISVWGARIIGDRPWKVDDSVVISDYAAGLRATGDVVYCQNLEDGRFAMGIRFRESLATAFSDFVRD
jgi:hypothetical protein